jgi:hypothetical protein
MFNPKDPGMIKQRPNSIFSLNNCTFQINNDRSTMRKRITERTSE